METLIQNNFNFSLIVYSFEIYLCLIVHEKKCMNPWLQRREQVEREVRILREKISVLKIQISTITKGVPMSKIEVREDKRGLMRSSSPDEKFRSISLPTSGTTLRSSWMKFTPVSMFIISGKSPERSYSPTMRHTAHGILKSQQSLASEILAWSEYSDSSDLIVY